MKITRVEPILLDLPMAPLDPPAVGGETSARHTLVRVETDEGITGIGECFRLAPRTMAAAIEEVLAPLLLGADPTRIETLWERLYRQTFRFGRKGLVVHAISGVEVALWDILGKSVGMPVAALLGGPGDDGIEAYASMHRFASPGAVADTAVRLVEEGYRAVKLHQKDLASVEAARRAIGPDIRLMVDAAGAWSQPEAARMVDAMAELGVHWLEEPLADMDDYRGLAELRAWGRLRIAAGENEYTPAGFRELLDARAVDVVQPDVIKAGGILATRKIIAMAEAHNAEICTHSFYYGPGVAATLQVALASPRCRMVEINPHDLVTDFMDPPLRPREGRIALPAKPGIGVDLLDDVVARHDVTRR